MGDFLFNFISKMELLVALCFTSFRVHPDVFKELNRRVTEEIVPLRPPSFWFHLGPKPPNANDHSVPRIHSDEIVHPIDWFYSPPKFDWHRPPGNLWASSMISIMGFEIQNCFPILQINMEIMIVILMMNVVWKKLRRGRAEEVRVLIKGTSIMKTIISFNFRKEMRKIATAYIVLHNVHSTS